MTFDFEILEPRLQMARPEPSLAENVKFRLPLSSDVTTHYYFDRDDTTAAHAWDGSTHTYDGHKGADFSGGPAGRPVYAAADGILIAKVDGLPPNDGTATGNGNYVRINHGNDRTGKPINSVYLHFTAGTVTTKPIGSFISAGEQIGGVGTSGHSTGLHLHFETQLARVAFDPFKATGSTETSWWVNQGSGSPSTTANTAKLKAGDTAEVYDLPSSSLTVRSAAAGTSIGTEPNAATGTVLEGPVYSAFSGDIDNNLWVWYRVQWSNGLTGWSAQNWLRGPGDYTAPVVQSSTFNFETAPHKLTLRFSEYVAPTLDASDFIVTRLSTGEQMPITANFDVLSGFETVNFNRVLPDGNYRLRIPAGAIADNAGNALAADYLYNFNVLAGDANRDGAVNFADLVIVSQNYGKTGQTFSQGNFDYSTNGTVDFGDLVLLSQNYNTTAAASLSVVDATTPTKHNNRVAKSIL